MRSKMPLACQACYAIASCHRRFEIIQNPPVAMVQNRRLANVPNPAGGNDPNPPVVVYQNRHSGWSKIAGLGGPKPPVVMYQTRRFL
jgi:hypothetical protein